VSIAMTTAPAGLSTGPASALFILPEQVNATELLRSYGEGFGGSGLTWQSVAIPTQCQTTTQNNAGLVMVAHDLVLILWSPTPNVVCISNDDGQTWEVQAPSIALGSATYSDIYSLKLTSGQFGVANGLFLGDSGYSGRSFFLTSTDGTAWQAASTPINSCSGYTQSNDLIAYASTKWIDLDYICRDNNGLSSYAIASSTDGITWTYVAQPPASPSNSRPAIGLAVEPTGGVGGVPPSPSLGSLSRNFWVIPGTNDVIITGAWMDSSGNSETGLVRVSF
jgi:hypothetical protein